VAFAGVGHDAGHAQEQAIDPLTQTHRDTAREIAAERGACQHEALTRQDLIDEGKKRGQHVVLAAYFVRDRQPHARQVGIDSPPAAPLGEDRLVVGDLQPAVHRPAVQEQNRPALAVLLVVDGRGARLTLHRYYAAGTAKELPWAT